MEGRVGGGRAVREGNIRDEPELPPGLRSEDQKFEATARISVNVDQVLAVETGIPIELEPGLSRSERVATG